MIAETSYLEEEADQVKFFATYSFVNNSLEERFVDLLLSMDQQKVEVNPEEMCSVDLTEIVEDLKAVTQQKCNGI